MPDSLQIALKNDGDLDNLFAYITGIAIQHDGQRCFLKADGKSLYFPKSPSNIGSPLTDDCAIFLGAPGSTTNVTIPQIAGGRIWISEGPLTFLLNPGPGLVEPSVLNPSDPNSNVNFGFCEFTLDPAQLYANISYVDFVSRIPIAITLQENSGQIQSVAGMAPDGIDRLADSLREQAQKEGRPWDKLVIERDGRVLRILNATHGGAVGADFSGYYEPYVEEVWKKFKSGSSMQLDTQGADGVLRGSINDKEELVIGKEAFSKPTTADILGCNSGPFTTGPSSTRNAIIPRLASGFVRSTFLVTDQHPSTPDTFYTTNPTNHYARLVHQHNIDRKGYAYAYDDCVAGPDDQSGKVNAGDPVLFTVTIGGKSAANGGRSVIPSVVDGGDRNSSSAAPSEQSSTTNSAGGLRGKLSMLKGKFLH